MLLKNNIWNPSLDFAINNDTMFIDTKNTYEKMDQTMVDQHRWLYKLIHTSKSSHIHNIDDQELWYEVSCEYVTAYLKRALSEEYVPNEFEVNQVFESHHYINIEIVIESNWIVSVLYIFCNHIRPCNGSKNLKNNLANRHDEPLEIILNVEEVVKFLSSRGT